MIDTFVFDIGNVLLDFNYPEQYRAIYDEQTARALADATVRNTALWAEMDRGVLSYDRVIALLQKDTPHLAQEIAHAIPLLYRQVRPFPYAKPWLCALKEKGYRIYILSNYGELPYAWSKPRMDFLPYADGALISYEVQDIKPSRAVFETLCDRFAIDPQRAVFIDDAAANIAAAEAFGLNAVLFTGYTAALDALRDLPLAYGV